MFIFKKSLNRYREIFERSPDKKTMIKIRSNNINYIAPKLGTVTNANKRTFSTIIKEVPKKAKNKAEKTVKGFFNEEFYKKYISSDEKIREILKTNSKKENMKFCLELGKIALILGGLAAVSLIPFPATGALYAASIPKLRKIGSKIKTHF